MQHGKWVFITPLLFSLVWLGGCSGPEVVAKEKELSSGVDLLSMDEATRPQDDFFQYVNGTWLKNTKIPDDKSSWGAFHELHDQSVFDVQVLIQEVAESNAAPKVAKLYNSFMDEDALEQGQLKSVRDELQRIENITSHEQLLPYFAYADRLGMSVPFGLYVSQDVKDVESYAVYLWQYGLGLPDREYYFDETDKALALQRDYKRYMATVLQLIEVGGSEAVAKDIYQLESQLAQHHWTRVKNRNAEKTYNKFLVSELSAEFGEMNWGAYLSAAGVGEQSYVIVGQPEYFSSLKETIQSTPVSLWRNYLKVRLLTSLAPYAYSQLYDPYFEFYLTQLKGVKESEPRWKRAVGFINKSVGERIGELYVERHFSEAAKQRMEVMVTNLLSAYRQSIESLDWMTPETKQQALIKLSKFTAKIGYPDQWRDYSRLEVSDDLMSNALAVRRFEHDFQLSKLGQPINRKEWHMTPQTVNAYYNPAMNEIVFPAAILQPPFFNLDAEDAINYGAVGAVIGHEIGHGFDDQGSKYNGDGYLKNWWAKSDRENFEEKTSALVTQYNQFEPLQGEFINGELTLGENIGDIAGLSIAYKAYQLSLNGDVAPVMDGFTGAQRLFIGWGQVWRGKMRDEALSTRLKTDPHSPAEYRVQGVLPNVNGFYDAFDVRPDDALYLPEAERVTVW